MALATSNTLYGAVLVTTHPLSFNYDAVEQYNTEFLVLGSDNLLNLAKHRCNTVEQVRADDVNTYKAGSEETSFNEIANFKVEACAPYLDNNIKKQAISGMDITIRIWDNGNKTYYPTNHTLSNSSILEFAALPAELQVEVYSNPQLTNMVGVFNISNAVTITGNGNYNTTRTKYNDSIMIPIGTQNRTIYGQWELRDIILKD